MPQHCTLYEDCAQSSGSCHTLDRSCRERIYWNLKMQQLSFRSFEFIIIKSAGGM